jgi:hypothetical protein
MPYINQFDRPRYDSAIDELIKLIDSPGELNYVISRIAKGMISKKGGRYINHNEVIGAIECAKIELYRRLTGPYEDRAIVKNGDIK